MNQGFTFYGSFTDALDEIPDKEVRYELMDAIITYGAKGIVLDDMSSYAKAMFALIKPNIDTNLKKRAGGAKGGRPSKKETIETESEKPMVSKNKNHRFQEDETIGYETSETEIEIELEKDIELEKERKDNTQGKKKPIKHKYGEYKNVLLTDEEYEKLSKECNVQEMIERLSAYIESKGTKYKSHYATIRNWVRRDRKEGEKSAASGISYTEDEINEIFAADII